MASSDTQNKKFIASVAGAAFISLALGFGIGQSSGMTAGKAEGYAAGFAEGDQSGWGRAVEATTIKAYWAGAIDACNTVFDATGWEYIYVNPMAGGGTISREYFCRDNGNYEGTPVLDIPYVPSADGSN